MIRYEYAFFTLDDLHLMDAIAKCNEMSKEGWELVSHSVYLDSSITVGRNVYHYYYLKREII